MDVFISTASGIDEPVNLAFTPAQQVRVIARADTPTVTGTVTNEDVQSSSGLVIDRNALDGVEVTHFKLTNISNGALYHSDGVTVINDGDFITVVAYALIVPSSPYVVIVSPRKLP